MAKLRDEKWMIKKLINFYNNTGYSMPHTYQYRLRQISTGISEADFIQSLQTKSTFRDWLFYTFRKKYYESPKYQLDRMHKLRELYNSCCKDGFIVPVYSNSNDTWRGQPTQTGIVESEQGKELTHFWGFIEASLKKYPTKKLIIYTSISTILSVAVLGWIIIHTVPLVYHLIIRTL